MTPLHDAVVLAGGAAQRLDGISKPDLVVAQRRLLDHVLAATTEARRVVVVGPGHLKRAGVLLTREVPSFGGPVAGIDAGLTALDRAAEQAGEQPSPWLLVLACDVPLAERVVPRLLAAASGAADGARLVDRSGHAQPLLAVYLRAALDRALARLRAERGVRDVPVRRLVDSLDLLDVPDDEDGGMDVDTWDDVDLIEARLGGEEHMTASGPTSTTGPDAERTPPLVRWVRELAVALDVDPGVADVRALLDLARDAAHSVERPAAPLTTFLVGYAAARAGGGADAVASAARTASERALAWRPEDPETPDTPRED